MDRGGPRAPGPGVPVYVISVAAELTACTRRRCGPTTGSDWSRRAAPAAAVGATRCTTIELLREVAELTSTGIGLEGVRRILELEHQVAALRARNAELKARAASLEAALETTVSALHDRRPNLPVLRSTFPLSPFDERP